MILKLKYVTLSILFTPVISGIFNGSSFIKYQDWVK